MTGAAGNGRCGDQYRLLDALGDNYTVRIATRSNYNPYSAFDIPLANFPFDSLINIQ